MRIDPRYGRRPPWHDLQLELQGPAVLDIDLTFRQRWEDRSPRDHRNPPAARGRSAVAVYDLECAVLHQRRDPRTPADPAGLGDQARAFARELHLRLCRLAIDPDGRPLPRRRDNTL